MSAVTYLQRALLVHDLQTLSAVEWEACFNKVLFPLLAKLLERINPQDPVGMEETRVRGATLLSKVCPITFAETRPVIQSTRDSCLSFSSGFLAAPDATVGAADVHGPVAHHSRFHG